jgi:hypothetical protein
MQVRFVADLPMISDLGPDPMISDLRPDPMISDPGLDDTLTFETAGNPNALTGSDAPVALNVLASIRTFAFPMPGHQLELARDQPEICRDPRIPRLRWRAKLFN